MPIALCLLIYLLAYLLHTRVKTVPLYKLFTLLLSPWLKRQLCLAFLVTYVSGKLFITHAHTHTHTPALYWHMHNSFHSKRISVSLW